MNLSKSGQRNLVFKFRTISSLLMREYKIEILIIVSFFVFISLTHSGKISNNIFSELLNFFTDARCSNILSFFSIVIGIYITIWSIFSTSASKINEEILKAKIDGHLFFIICINIFETLLLIIFLAFIPTSFTIYKYSIVPLCAISSISFIKFIILLIYLTKINIEFIIKDIDESNARDTDIEVKIDEIYNRIIKKL